MKTTRTLAISAILGFAFALCASAKVVYDEEVALRYNHDTIYAYSDRIPTQYRTIYQDLFHYGNAIDLGRESVRTCFLQGNYDFVIGGCQAQPTTKRTKFWGKFGPETAGWDFDTPEDPLGNDVFADMPSKTMFVTGAVQSTPSSFVTYVPRPGV